MLELFEHILSIWTWLIQNLFLINVVLSIIIIFFQRRDPKAVWTWLLALYFVPVFGIFFYIIFGQDFRKSKMFKLKEADDKISKKVVAQGKFFKQYKRYLGNSFFGAYEKLILYNLKEDKSVFTLDNGIEVFNDGKKKFKDLIYEIRNAKTYIHIQYYIIKNDYLFDTISQELVKKTKEGVEVRLLMDGMGGRFMPVKKLNELKSSGIKIGVFFPATLGKINLRINFRNHRKIVVIDGNIAYLGGFNIGKEYLGEEKKFGYWRDTHLKLSGESVISLQTRFALDWNYATGENIFLNGKYFTYKNIFSLPKYNSRKNLVNNSEIGVQIITSGPDSATKQIRDNYIELFRLAREHIYIHTPYFIPDDSVISALLFSIKSGVDVRLMIPSKPDHPFVFWASLSWAATILEAGAKVYTYQDGFLHAKSVMIDGKCACVGTANMDIRSFELNFEVNATIYNEEVARILEENFLNDIINCRMMKKEVYEQRGLIQRFKEQVSRLLSPLL